MALSLTADHSLGIEIAADAAGLTGRWLPRDLPAPSSPHRALITVAIGAPRQVPESAPTLRVGPVRGWLGDGHLLLYGARAGGDVDLSRGRAELRVTPEGGAETEMDLYAMLTISAGVLLAGLGRALIHGAAAAPPGPGGAWVLLGDSGSGKSTTCATLARAGWRYLSDDQVILGPADRGLTVEGWVRPFHLDGGWSEGAPTGDRRSCDPLELFPGGRLRVAPLAGLLLPQVAGGKVTQLSPADPAEALAELVRQSPWVLLDRGAAPRLLELLNTAASRCRPPRRLVLGVDSYGVPDRMSSVLASLAE